MPEGVRYPCPACKSLNTFVWIGYRWDKGIKKMWCGDCGWSKMEYVPENPHERSDMGTLTPIKNTPLPYRERVFGRTIV